MKPNANLNVDGKLFKLDIVAFLIVCIISYVQCKGESRLVVEILDKKQKNIEKLMEN